ncbi:MAG: thioredoxin domain-containing protein [Spirochaetales bacterium]|nr:thioredoxin domain-containing protein [Leptospiraceae bacterium]MCP5480383.1 thioredoxin domain-containing protein [Spirochaetales bacterium]
MIRIAKLCLIAAPLLVLLNCDRGPSVTVNGETLTESDLPERVRVDIQRQRDEMVGEALHRMAFDRLFRLAAEEENLSVPEYQAQLQARAGVPEEAEVRQAFEEARAQGQTGNQSYESLRERIYAHLQQQRRRQIVQSEMTRLQEKYGFDFNRGAAAPATASRVEIPIENEPSRNGQTARVVIVEFSDFACPYCRVVQETSRRLREKYGDQIRWVVKDFPLDQIHPMARAAHVAANCILAQDQAAYWKFFDDIYHAGSEAFGADALASRARSLGVDMTRYQACTSDPAIEAEINQDIIDGESVGVGGTPAIFVNGQFMEGGAAQTFESYVEIIDRELQG